VTVQLTGDGQGALVSTTALDEVAGTQQRDVVDRLAQLTGATRDQIEVNAIGPRWGEQISRQALEGLVAFLVLVGIYIAFRFEWRMAVAALVTLLHDVMLTIGIYALVGFQVTPASVIALLTILGYSLYDTVVVFDRVAEDTARLGSSSSRPYSDYANDSLNHVIVRSLSTSITSLLPVGALLFIGAQLLGATTLQDLALALFIGMAVGTYSSLVVATPLLCWLKEREPRYRELRHRLETRRGRAS
jgi:preprotein translocase subunit SecF